MLVTSVDDEAGARGASAECPVPGCLEHTNCSVVLGSRAPQRAQAPHARLAGGAGCCSQTFRKQRGDICEEEREPRGGHPHCGLWGFSAASDPREAVRVTTLNVGTSARAPPQTRPCFFWKSSPGPGDAGGHPCFRGHSGDQAASAPPVPSHASRPRPHGSFTFRFGEGGLCLGFCAPLTESCSPGRTTHSNFSEGR